MGPSRFELLTSSLSGTRSNQLSYEPGSIHIPGPVCAGRVGDCKPAGDLVNCSLSIPVEGFQMGLQVGGAVEAVEDQRIF